MTLGIPVPGRVTHPTLALYPTGPGEEGTSYLERSPALSRGSDYRVRATGREGAGEVSRGHSSRRLGFLGLSRRAESSNAGSSQWDSRRELTVTVFIPPRHLAEPGLGVAVPTFPPF